MGLTILGAGGHAKVVIDACRSVGINVCRVYDDDRSLAGAIIMGVTVGGSILEALQTEANLHLAIGSAAVRARYGQPGLDIRFPPLVHSHAWVSESAFVSQGVFVGAGAVVQAEAWIGRHVIVNSLALIEHDARIGAYSHIAPGARLGGNVTIGEGTLVGIGATVLPGIAVGSSVIIGAGAVVLSDVPDSSTIVGNPARYIHR
jgi:sugar O-acyltransferase (sialic acid O-acetyltransferase NeuD family)